MAFTIEDAGEPDVLSDRLYQELLAHKVQEAGSLKSEMIALSVHDGAGDLIAGLTGEMFWNALVIRQLWVDVQYRRRGIGRAMMVEAERRARQRPCDLIYVSTFEFQGPEFYERLGFVQFGALPIPQGAGLRYFQKDLRSAGT